MKKFQLIISLLITSAIVPPTVDAQDTSTVDDGQMEVKEFKRNLESIPFVPKGQWITGISVNYTASTQDNYQFLIVENLNGDTYSFKISPQLLYCFRDNMAAGGRFSYARSMTKLNSADVKLDSETEYNTDNLYRASNNFYTAALFRYYLSMGRSKRFGFFTECQLQLGGGQSKLCNGSGDDLTGTYESNFNLNVGISPGLIMFLNNYSAIEVNVGLLGFNYVNTKSTTDQVYVAHRSSQQALFNINLFSITFGCTFYL